MLSCKKSDTKEYYSFHLCEVPLNCRRESRMVVSRGLGRSRELLFSSCRVQWDEERGLEMDSGDGSTAKCVWLIPPNCTIKNAEPGKDEAN